MIITSLLDTDLYKFTMQQIALHRFPDFEVRYAFRCRNADIDFSPYLDKIRIEINNLCTLKLDQDELDYLSTLRFLRKDYIDFLRIFQLNNNFIEVDVDNGDLEVNIQGPWLHTILFEVPVLAIINEVFFENNTPVPDYRYGKEKLNQKIEILKENSFIKFADFGTRRRRNKKWHEEIMEILKNEVPENLLGTSNVKLAMNFNLTPIGTMAHEFFQACQGAEVRLINSQKFALEAWVREYRGDLGIALTDVIGMDSFLKDFDLYFCKLFDGARHDSGDPFVWCRKLINHYNKMNIDPKQKTAVFSDGLDFEKARELAQTFKEEINVVFGIGTNLTNDFPEKALQIVIKMIQCNGQAVAKISDTPGKTMCRDESYIQYLKNVFDVK